MGPNSGFVPYQLMMLLFNLSKLQWGVFFLYEVEMIIYKNARRIENFINIYIAHYSARA